MMSPIPISVTKYLSISAESLAPKPLSIIRRTAIGTDSMASAETTRATTAPAKRPLVRQDQRLQRQERAKREGRPGAVF